MRSALASQFRDLRVGSPSIAPHGNRPLTPLTVYVDGSCFANTDVRSRTSAAGWGVVIVDPAAGPSPTDVLRQSYSTEESRKRFANPLGEKADHVLVCGQGLRTQTVREFVAEFFHRCHGKQRLPACVLHDAELSKASKRTTPTPTHAYTV